MDMQFHRLTCKITFEVMENQEEFNFINYIVSLYHLVPPCQHDAYSFILLFWSVSCPSDGKKLSSPLYPIMRNCVYLI